MLGAPEDPRRESEGDGLTVEHDAALSLSMGERQKRLRRFWRSIPSPPRCKLCHRPFAGIGGPAMRLIGLGPWPANPKYCRGCFRDLYRHHAGAEIECSLVFADVRNSTALAERMRPAEFHQRMNSFYKVAFDVLVGHDAFVDKFVGDEVIGIFVPALTDGRHARQAVNAALGILRAVRRDGDRPWLPVGVGVNAGVAYVGAVGTDQHVEFTALGDPVNVAARLASEAGAGEVLVTEETLTSAAWDPSDLPSRRLVVRGKTQPIDVRVLTAEAAPAP